MLGKNYTAFQEMDLKKIGKGILEAKPKTPKDF